MGKAKKIYICCTKDQRPYLEAKAESIFGDRCQVVNNIGDAETAYIIWPTDITQANLQEELFRAEELGVSLQYVNRDFINEDIYEKMLYDKPVIDKKYEKRTERKRTQEMER